MVRSARSCSLFLNDVVGTIRDANSFGGRLLRVAGVAGDEPNIPAVVKMTMEDDITALRPQLLEWSAIPTLTRIIVSHRDIIQDNPRQAFAGTGCVAALGGY